MTSSLRVAGLFTALACVSLVTASLQAADLRRTSQGQTVHRRVSRVQPAQWVEVAPRQLASGEAVQDSVLSRGAGPVAGRPVVEMPSEPVLMEPGDVFGQPYDSACDSCGPDCGPSCGHGCRSACGVFWDCNRPCGYWTNLELLLWWRRGRNFPPLVTSSTDPMGTGALDEAGTIVLFGDDTEGDTARTGARISIGRWLDACQNWGVESRFFMVDDAPVRFNQASNGTPVLARPFFNVDTGQQDSVLLAFPGEFSGDVSLESRSEILGAEFYLRRLLGQACGWRFDLLGGYYYSRIDEDLRIVSNNVALRGTPVPVGTTTQLVDVFDTRNKFNGGQIGFLSEFDNGCWTFSVLGKMALGNMRQQVTIDGQTTVTVPPPNGGTSVSDGGLLALGTNSGFFERDVFAVVPELGLTAGYRLHPCIDLTLGYSLVYWSRVAQPGDQIDTLINPTQQAGGGLVGAARPEFQFQDSTYWVHGLRFGVECRF